MTHFLRRGRQTIVDADVSKADLHVLICVKEYSSLLLGTPADKQPELIKDFDALQELRGAWFEAVTKPADTPDEFVKAELRAMAKKWDLTYVTD